MFSKFWNWYERNYKLNVGIAAGLFLLQIFHLIWLLSEVIWAKIFGSPLATLHGLPKIFILFVDFTEIPALLGASLIYINELRKRFNLKSLLYLIFLNSQWLHIFWITDEFVADSFVGSGSIFGMPVWLAWIAILIDYLELPVIYDTVKRFLATLKHRSFSESLLVIKEE